LTEARTPAEAAAWPEHILEPAQAGLVELLLLGALAPREGFTEDLPLTVTGDVQVAPGQLLALRDAEGVTLAGVEVATGPPSVTGRLVAVSGVAHHDALDLRQTPDHVRAWAAGRALLGVLGDGPLSDHQLDAVVAAAGPDDAVLLLAMLGPHDVGDAAWYARAAAARATADALRARLGRDRIALVAVPDPGRADLRSAMVRSFGAEPLAVPAPQGAWPAVVEQALGRFSPTPLEQGVVVLFTGLSGSGKSTVARAVSARLMELGPRRVTLLDGDVVRRSLSSELGFSREHRDLNVRRIGWVAAEIGRHGGLAVACPIAPYAGSRAAVRAMAERAGAAFVLVHVSTPLEVCESRDRKGLYALARAGTLPEFTGVSDPYDVPTDADVVLDTSTVPVDDAAERVLSELRGRGLVA
jgi:sulfate adenylyltransferase